MRTIKKSYVGHEDAVVNAHQTAAPHLNGETGGAARIAGLQLGRARLVVQH